ncbi:manganese and iron superoxide dismutase [Xylariaceae sp. FL1019]|nr:manganese and iron superoxide dismutase [Xylariaceae sp. FL1019]
MCVGRITTRQLRIALGKSSRSSAVSTSSSVITDRRLASSTAMLRTRLRIPRAGGLFRPAPAARTIHLMPKSDFDQLQEVPMFLSPAAYNMAWTDYMNLMIKELNARTSGTEFYDKNTLQIVKNVARDPSQAALFNHASMAWNNSFFFRQLRNASSPATQPAQEQEPSEAPQTDGTTPISQIPAELEQNEDRIHNELRSAIDTHFSSVETLRRELYFTAMSMFGPGFVWLVKKAHSNQMSVLVTYLAGSPFTAAHWRRQGLDMNTSSADSGSATDYFDRNRAGAEGSNSGKFLNSAATAPGGVDVVPLLCLNTWEHVWMRDYGVAGKSNYVLNWWEVIDWNKVYDLWKTGEKDKFQK